MLLASGWVETVGVASQGRGLNMAFTSNVGRSLADSSAFRLGGMMEMESDGEVEKKLCKRYELEGRITERNRYKVWCRCSLDSERRYHRYGTTLLE
jgi:hypothetical protein